MTNDDAEEIIKALYPQGEERYMLIKITDFELARKNLKWNEDNGLGFIVTGVTTQTPVKFRTYYLENIKEELQAKVTEILNKIDSIIFHET